MIDKLEKEEVKLFNNDSDLRNILAQYRTQAPCKQFIRMDIPLYHCYETYKYIYAFIDSIPKEATLKHDVNIIDISRAGLFHHINIDNEDFKEIIESNIGSNVWNILSAYRLIEEKVIEKYNETINIKDERLIGEPTKNDLSFSQLMKVLIEENFSQATRPMNYYLLLFFDLLTSFQYFNKKNTETKELINISQFILRVLPLVIGRYKFGSYSTKLQDLAFYCLDKTTYLNIESAIRSQSTRFQFMDQLESEIRKILEASNIGAHIFKRKKGIFSTYIKVYLYNTKVEQLWDLSGIRVVLNSQNSDDCYFVLAEIYNLLGSSKYRWKIWDNAKGYFDYIKMPKDNGYKSIHVVIQNEIEDLVEIQIRTSEMDNIAEFGDASHEAYKIHSIKKDNKEPKPVTPAEKGKRILEFFLKSENLTMNDFIKYLGFRLKHISIEHYYEGIVKGIYDPGKIVEQIRKEHM